MSAVVQWGEHSSVIFSPGRNIVRKSTLYALLGVAGVILVIAVIVALGQNDTKPTTPAATMSLPPGHVPVFGTPAPNAQADQVSAMIKALEEQSAAKPGDVTLKMQLASAYMMGSMIDKAAAIYEGILKDDPSNTDAQVQLALVWQAQGNSDKALPAILAVIKADENNQSAHAALAIVYYSTQQMDKAMAEWKRTVEIDPKSSDGKSAQMYLDMIAKSTGSPSAHP